MTRLLFLLQDPVFLEGLEFTGKPCPFLADVRCSVYEARPLVCRTYHSLRTSAALCSMDIPAAQQVRAPMYDPDNIEMLYSALNEMYSLLKPCGNIGEFF